MQTDRFQDNVSKKGNDSGINWNDTISEAGQTLRSIFGKPQTTTIVQSPIQSEDNTALYVGLGGAALLVILLIVFLK